MGMEIIPYLKEIYGYDTPIFLKDIKIRKKSKAAIKQELYRANKRGDINREANGIYYFKSDKEFGSGIRFNELIEKKYVRDNMGFPGLEKVNVYGYYTGVTFLNQIHYSEQVPAVIEITTNNCKSNKRMIKLTGMMVVLRKPKTKITSANYKTLQFLDMFRWMDIQELENKKTRDFLRKYIASSSITKTQVNDYIKLYSKETTQKLIVGKVYDSLLEQ